jgi:hypothetical protein
MQIAAEETLFKVSQSLAESVTASRLRRSGVELGALATATRGFRLLLTALDARLHVMTAHLELTQNAFGGELALEHFDRALDAAIAHEHLERFALNGFAGHGSRVIYLKTEATARKIYFLPA